MRSRKASPKEVTSELGYNGKKENREGERRKRKGSRNRLQREKEPVCLNSEISKEGRLEGQAGARVCRV